MDALRWLRKNGEIIGCEIDGIEYTLIAIMKNPVLHKLYHEQIDKQGGNYGTVDEHLQLGTGE